MPYPGIYPWVRAKLRDSLNGIENDELDPEIASVLRQILGPFSITYDSLSADDKVAVDEAAGLRTAVRVHAQYVTGGVSTDLRSEDTIDGKRSFGNWEDLKAEWLAQAAVALSSTSFATTSGSDGPRFAVNGPSRSRCRDRYVDQGCEPWPC